MTVINDLTVSDLAEMEGVTVDEMERRLDAHNIPQPSELVDFWWGDQEAG